MIHLLVKFHDKIDIAGLLKLARRSRAENIKTFDMVLPAQIGKLITMFIN